MCGGQLGLYQQRMPATVWPWHKYPTRPSQISGYRIWSKARKYPGYIREIYEKVTLDIRHARRVSVTIICVYIFLYMIGCLSSIKYAKPLPQHTLPAVRG